MSRERLVTQYSEETFAEILREAGLIVRWHGTNEDGRFLMALASPA